MNPMLRDSSVDVGAMFVDLAGATDRFHITNHDDFRRALPILQNCGIRVSEGKYVALTPFLPTIVEALAAHAETPTMIGLGVLKAILDVREMIPELSKKEIIVLEAVYQLTGRAAGKAPIMTLKTGQSKREDIQRTVGDAIAATELDAIIEQLKTKKLLREEDGHYHLAL